MDPILIGYLVGVILFYILCVVVEKHDSHDGKVSVSDYAFFVIISAFWVIILPLLILGVIVDFIFKQKFWKKRF